MVAQYLLPCPECSHSIPVSPQMAGREVDCPECNHTLEIPTLGKLRQYEVQAESSESDQPKLERNRTRGLLFSTGLILTAIFGIGAAALYYTAQNRAVDIDVEKVIEEATAPFETAAPGDLYRAWAQTPRELGEWHEYEFVRLNREAKVLQTFAHILAALAAIGLIIFLVSFVVPARPQTSR